MANLVFFLVVGREEMITMEDAGEIGVGDFGYIGLHERAEDALECYVLVERSKRKPAPNLLPAMMARIVFSEAALLNYLTACVGAIGDFRPYKQDWKVWHCQAPIPLRQPKWSS